MIKVLFMYALLVLLDKFFIRIRNRARAYLYNTPTFPKLLKLQRLHLDGTPFVLFWVVLANHVRILQLFYSRAIGVKPAVIFLSEESDGRFDRLFYNFRHRRKEIVFLKLPIATFLYNEFFFQPFFKEYEQAHPTAGRYINVFERYFHKDNIENRKKYRTHCDRIVNILNHFFSPFMIIVGSPDDAYSVELSYAARAAGIKWAICEREGTHTGRSARALAELFQKYRPLEFDHIFTANPLHFECYQNSLKSKEHTKMHLLGELRSDSWITRKYKFNRPQYKSWEKYNFKILFLTFGERNYIEPMYHPHVKGSWLPLLKDCENVVEIFAKKHSDTIVFYKMGHTEDFHADFMKRCESQGLSNIVPLDRSFPCEELISYCDLIIGFQSTAVIEAMYTTKPIAYLNWNFPPEVDREFDILPIHNSNAVYVASSKEQLDSFLSNHYPAPHAISDSEIAARKQCINDFFYDSNGKVAERFVSELLEIAAGK